MIDLPLFAELFSSIKHCRLFIVGDENQLPPIGIGKSFVEMIGKMNKIALTKVHRQNQGKILHYATQIKDGVIPHIVTGDGVEIYSTFNINMLNDMLHTDWQIIIPKKAGEVGTEELNLRIQSHLGIETNGKFGVGERIFITQNNYDLSVFNRDVGVVTEIKPNDVIVEIDEKKVTIPKTLNIVELGYAITIHKSQGSGYDSVMLILDSTTPPPMRIRSILFT
ncbi:hypothetical protein P9112_009612 [Eukaryota sp. TZLM1-RC]